MDAYQQGDVLSVSQVTPDVLSAGRIGGAKPFPLHQPHAAG
jgi:hypothetical protein